MSTYIVAQVHPTYHFTRDRYGSAFVTNNYEEACKQKKVFEAKCPEGWQVKIFQSIE